jgi:hypothetical protein
MGFFSSIRNWIKDKVRKVVNWVAEKLGDSKPLNQTSSTQQVTYTSDSLWEYSNQYRQLARDIENDCMTLVQRRFEETMNLLTSREELRSEFKQEIKAMRRRHQELCAAIPDAITNVIAKRVSIDDYECRQILSLAAGDSKKYKLRNFCEAVVHEANDNLARRVQAALVQQANEIGDALDEYMEEKERGLKGMQETFAELEKDALAETDETNRKRYLPMKLVYITEKAKNLFTA